jgi:hypothetical protein
MNGAMRKGVQVGVVLDKPRPRMVAVAEDHGDTREEAPRDRILAGPGFDAVEHSATRAVGRRRNGSSFTR